MAQFKWKGYTWRVGQLWGMYHPDFLKSWYSPKAVSIDEDVLRLTIKRLPLEIIENGEKITIPYGVGLITCTEEFGYGTYEWKMKLPKGKDIVGALWLASNSDWPPEIDCVEAFSGSAGDYIRRFFWRNIEPNIHYRDKNGQHQERGAYATFRWLFKKDGVIDYKIVFRPDSIKIYYNNIRVACEKRKRILQDFKDVKFFPIININVMEPYEDKNIDECDSIMEVHDFKFTAL